MPADSLPMVRIVRKRGEVEEIVVGPTAGKTLVRVLLIVAVVALLVANVIQRDDFAAAVTAVKLWW
jgi:hypothetical protein